MKATKQRVPGRDEAGTGRRATPELRRRLEPQTLSLGRVSGRVTPLRFEVVSAANAMQASPRCRAAAAARRTQRARAAPFHRPRFRRSPPRRPRRRALARAATARTSALSIAKRRPPAAIAQLGAVEAEHGATERILGRPSTESRCSAPFRSRRRARGRTDSRHLRRRGCRPNARRELATRVIGMPCITQPAALLSAIMRFSSRCRRRSYARTWYFRSPAGRPCRIT